MTEPMPSPAPLSVMDLDALSSVVRDGSEAIACPAEMFGRLIAQARRAATAEGVGPVLSAAKVDAIYEIIRNFQVSNMADDEGNCFPLVDLMSAEGRDIGDGEAQMRELAYQIELAAQLTPPAAVAPERPEGERPMVPATDLARVQSERDALRAEVARLTLRLEIAELGRDLAYKNGASAGWNLCFGDDRAGLAKIETAANQVLAPLKAAHAKLAALAQQGEG